MTAEPDGPPTHGHGGHDLDALIARARAAQVDATVLVDLVINASVENAVAKTRFSAAGLSPTSDATTTAPAAPLAVLPEPHPQPSPPRRTGAAR